MDDEKIVQLFWDRSEEAISQTDKKYGKMCFSVSNGVLCSEEDAKECVNDAYLSVWNNIPPQKPRSFSAFLTRIVRNISINRYNYNKADKRRVNMSAILEEIDEFTPDSVSVESEHEKKQLITAINNFVAGLPNESRVIFVRRYWYMSPVKEIARDYSVGESYVKIRLMRTRNMLKEYLESEGFEL